MCKFLVGRYTCRVVRLLMCMCKGRKKIGRFNDLDHDFWSALLMRVYWM